TTVFRASLGNSDRPFARPGDWVTLTLDAMCDAASPGFSGTAANVVVSVIFTPPAGGPRNVVALATNCAAVDTASCAAQPDVAAPTCLPVNLPADPVALEIVDQRTLRFRFPDTDAVFVPPNDNLTLTGPATVAVSPVGQPLPCQLAGAPC